jgi:hypothetical protein
MKAKVRIIACITAALYVFTGASVWEGAAAISSGGDLPETGYFAATSSFPKNTVIDITNLENDKTIRVIVSASLDTPGLLALLSKDAANMIGLQRNSIGRIRISQPSDPIAFSRFTDGLAAGDFSFYDSEDGIAAAGDDAADSVTVMTDDGTIAAGDAAVGSDSVLPGIPESEWNEADSMVIVELEEPPEFSVPGVPPDGAYPAEPDEPSLADAGERPETPPAETPAAVSALASPGEGGLYDYTLVPAEERPPAPEPSYIIDPDSIIPGISRGETARPEDEGYVFVPDTAPEIPEIPETVEEAVVFDTAPESAEETAPVLSAAAAPPLFTVPLISSLERGSYYVQLGAYSRPETIESEVARVGNAYPLALFNAGSSEKPVYRILLGPLNQGESGAVLKRFKSIGYKDAFVRYASR